MVVLTAARRCAEAGHRGLVDGVATISTGDQAEDVKDDQ
jgi:hypothetical protein